MGNYFDDELAAGAGAPMSPSSLSGGGAAAAGLVGALLATRWSRALSAICLAKRACQRWVGMSGGLHIPSPLGFSTGTTRRKAIGLDVSRARRNEMIPVRIHIQRVAQPTDGTAAQEASVSA